MTSNGDMRLVDRVLDGDEASFDVFFRSYYPRLYRFALSRLDGDGDLADETAQVVLCQAISKLDTYRGEAPLFSWLCTFCRYEVSRQRKARHRAQGDKPLAEEDPSVKAALESVLSETGRDPDVALYRDEIRRLIIVAVDHLPTLYADVLEAKYLHDRSVNDIAEQIGRSPKATESILTRARAAFRENFNSVFGQEREVVPGALSISSLVEY